jgi:DNA-binding MarR family transcriptional regulator
MADINIKQPPSTPLSDAEAVDLIELLFFAYRDFVADADHMLGELGFGRAHHRVLHFVGRSPGLTVAQLLDILQITKQSLSRVLKDLIEKGYVVQREGDEDRRQRLLFLTDHGQALWQRLVAPQKLRFENTLDPAGAISKDHARDLLFSLIDEPHRAAITHWQGKVRNV